ncbi:hypothetical protein QLX08_011590 [Tetragonisca angustula]|uniref:Uncharacterized protein n=1 Tax=Tetragonisca angustula TaxID=166442 RepID=A0AAW0Z858_9HYME
MAYVKMDDVVIPVFDYRNWKKCMLKFLQYKKCKLVVDRSKSAGDSSAEWDEMDIKAVNYIYSAINNKQLKYIDALDTAYEIIKKFDKMYLGESTALQIVCRNNVDAVKLKNYTDVTIFFDEFKKAVNDLKAMKLTEN